jgi:hypothetical protein
VKGGAGADAAAATKVLVFIKGENTIRKKRNPSPMASMQRIADAAGKE